MNESPSEFCLVLMINFVWC